MSKKSDPPLPPEFDALLEYIRRSRGFDLGAYKRPGLSRRIIRRMETVGEKDFAGYTDYLEVHPDEFTYLFNTILINVTSFFRDPEIWDHIAREILPSILAGKKPDEPIRVWSAGCATGEEPYTLAMLLVEALGPEQFDQRVKIFATDVDEEALSAARLANYAEQQVEGVPAHLLNRYFERAGDRYVFRKDFRRACIFGRHDLLQDAPISRVDILLCRNTAMYFNSEAQGRCLERFHFALNDSGVLVMGRAEMLFSRTSLFTPIDLKRHIFARVPREKMRDRLLVMAQSGTEQTVVPVAPGARAGDAIADHLRMRELAFDSDPIAQVVVDPDGFIALINDRARSLFNLNTRDVGRPLQDLELSYRPVELRSCIDKAKETRRALEMKDVLWPLPGGETHYLDAQVLPLYDSEDELLGVKASFQDVTRYKKLQDELQQSHQELETAYEELQSTNEERETANEELQSTNEELETTNEEIQSTSEELETMNEELQSSNEELQATNDELRQRSIELQQSNAFLNSILSSLRSGVVVIDKDTRVRAWNHRAEDLWGLRSEEVIGRHFLDLDIGLPVEQLRQIVRSGLNGTCDGSVIVPARNRRGRDFQCRVGCMPAAMHGQPIWGVVLTMDEQKKDS
jgi:two-component system CheB/CheR fusion protein